MIKKFIKDTISKNYGITTYLGRDKIYHVYICCNKNGKVFYFDVKTETEAINIHNKFYEVGQRDMLKK